MFRLAVWFYPGRPQYMAVDDIETALAYRFDLTARGYYVNIDSNARPVDARLLI